MKKIFSYNQPKYTSWPSFVGGLFLAFMTFKIGEKIDFALFKYLGVIFGLLSSVNSIKNLLFNRFIEITDTKIIYPALDIFQKPKIVPFNEIFSIEKSKLEQAIVKTIQGKSFVLTKAFMKQGEYENLVEILESRKTSNIKSQQVFQKNRIKERLLPYAVIIPFALLFIWMASRT